MSNKDKIITELLEKTQQMQEHMELQEKTIQILLRSNKQIIDWVDDIVKDQEHFRENYFFEISDPRLKEEVTEYWYPDIASVEETLDEIVNHGKSIARFGDGEFATIYGRVRHKFQTEQDDRLAARLLDVLASEDDRLMVAIADNYGNLERYSEQAKREIRFYLTRQVRKEHLQILKRDRKYYNAYVTRPYVMYNDSKTDCSQKRFENLKKSSMIMSNGGLSNIAKPIYEYLDKLIFENLKLSFELDKLISSNIWIEYFSSNEKYIKENWIDFESEISKVIRSLDNDILKNEGHSIDEEMISLSNLFLAKYYEEYTLVNQSVDLLNGENAKRITFRDIRDKLYYDLNRLIRALEIYLADYVEKIECNRVSPDIEKMSFDKVLSFNYTKTYTKLYDSCVCAEYDYIHGSTDIKNTIETNNMVLGIDEYLDDDRKNRDTDFIAFKKFYQRIYKETGCKYKDWITEIHSNAQIRNLNYCNKKDDGSKEYVSDYSVQHNLYIFGHSLDITDKDILRELILNDKVYTTIYYVNKDVMGKQIANLVKIIGQDELIRKTGGSDKTIEFRQQQAMQCISAV